jgi:hypothetical protein
LIVMLGPDRGRWCPLSMVDTNGLYRWGRNVASGGIGKMTRSAGRFGFHNTDITRI